MAKIWCYMKGEEIESCDGLFGKKVCRYAKKNCHIVASSQEKPVDNTVKG